MNRQLRTTGVAPGGAEFVESGGLRAEGRRPDDSGSPRRAVTRLGPVLIASSTVEWSALPEPASLRAEGCYLKMVASRRR
jgi:hypothetical protein